ncbi:OmpP1/FadL family transporter [Bradymonas sediminis]|uniref:Uncharacterized protein n=1 Tax=Bradymonas sediminis TaxID=1548548 RepID=A0A2Z4FNH4_9DELT|nr:outer membrane protein transport protein [Bradymonas sediminis]AWV90547.1 hypothetical protein DN745_14915 [Bradymonas sediminis]TDP72057.1 long-subunit fatty acid transport protein [Bradymonas sediminis]
MKRVQSTSLNSAKTPLNPLKKLSFLSIIGCALMLPSAASASPFEMYGAGGRASAMAGAQTASAEGAAAIFYNVGSLAHSEPGVSGGLTVGLNRSRILLMNRPLGYDIPDLGGYSPAIPSGMTKYERRDTTDVDNLYVLTLGGVTSFGIKDLRAGLLLAMPTSGYVDANTHFADERERIFSNQLHFTLTDQRLRRLDLEMGIAYKVADWISAGLGATFSPGTVMSTNVYLPNVGDQSDVDLNSQIDSESLWGLLAGVQVDFSEQLQFGLQYRSEVYFRIHGQNTIRVGNTGGKDTREIVQVLDWTPSYSPHSVSAGLAWTQGASKIMLDGRYERWSDYRNNHSKPTNFHDTISPRLGYEYSLPGKDDKPGNKLRAGLGWVPSPVPDQTGRTNYVDNDRAMASIGASYQLDAFGLPLEIDWALQLHVLMSRVTHKKIKASNPNCGADVDVICDEVPDDLINPRTGQPFEGTQGLQTGNPGFPGFTSGGWMGGVVVEVSWLP